jgi:hypothetical protein
MRMVIAIALALFLISRCAVEQPTDVPAGDAATSASGTGIAPATQTTASDREAATPAAAVQTTNENEQAGTWTGQIKFAEPGSVFNYVGAESGDFAPMRFRNDSDAGKRILAVCANDDLCEFTGVVEWLDETPPPDASAIGQIVRVDSVKRVASSTP